MGTVSSKRKPRPLELPAGVSSTADLGTCVPLVTAAQRLGLSPKTVRRMIDRGDLPGSHLEAMPGNRGQQWVVPVAALETVQVPQRRNQAQWRADPDLSSELETLRAAVARLERDLELQRALADERRTQLEQLHLTVRLALNAGPQPRRWPWSRRSTDTAN